MQITENQKYRLELLEKRGTTLEQLIAKAESEIVYGFQDLVGKEIKAVVHMKLVDYSDTGFLLLTLSDGLNLMLTARYSEYEVGGESEYPTRIEISNKFDVDRFEQIKTYE